MKRWIRRIFFILLGFLLVYSAVILAVLYTDIPRDLTLKILNDKYGLQVSIDSIEIESSKTTIQKLTLNLPMEHVSVLSVPQITINHSKIPFILFSGFKLKNITIDKPLLNISQNDMGKWNIERLSSHFSQSSSSGNNKQKNLSIPDLKIQGGHVTFADNKGNNENFGPIVFEGNSSKLHVWEFKGDFASLITLDGKLAQTGDLTHEVNIILKDLPDLIKNMIGDKSDIPSLNAKATWKGSIGSKGLSGKFRIEDAQAGNYHAEGNLGFQKLQDELIVNIENISFDGISESLEQIKLLSGNLRYDGKHVKAQEVFLEAAQNKIGISANWNIEERQGDFVCSLFGEINEINYDSLLSGNIKWPNNGKSILELSVNIDGQSPWGNLQTKAELTGSGENWLNSKWHTTVPYLQLNSEKYNIRLNDIHTEIAANWPVIKLDSLDLANAEKFNAKGEFSAETFDWNISLDTERLKVIEDQNSPVDMKLIAHGNLQNLSIEELAASYSNLQLTGKSDLSLSSMELSDTEINISMALDPKNTGNENLSGNLNCETEITGMVWPISIRCTSVFTADNIKVNNQKIEPVEIPWHADIDSNKIVGNSEEFRFFDGMWLLTGQFNFKQQSALMTLNTEQVSLNPVMKLFQLPIECKGLMKADLDVNIPLKNIHQMVLSGSWNVKDMSIPPIEAENAEGRIVIENGTAVFDRIYLRQDNGFAQADAWFRLDQPEYVHVNVDAKDWPINLEQSNLASKTNAEGAATINLSNRTIKGNGNLSTNISINRKHFANISSDIVIQERLLDFNDMKIDTLGGLAKGSISIPMDNLMNSKAYLSWDEMDLLTLTLYYPELKSLEGYSSGVFKLQANENKRAFEPLQIDIDGTISQGAIRGIDIGDFKISAHLGQQRLLVESAQIESLNGQIKSYGSISKHLDSYAMYMNSDFSNIDVNQLSHAFIPDAKPILGKLSGKGVLVIYSDLKRMTGDANIMITESDLAQTKIIGTLYNTMNLKFGKNQPSGYGRIKLRFEGSSLHIPSFEYFNRGVEVRGGGSIENLMLGKESNVKGYAFGSARPLKNVSLLGIGELDKLMTSLQTRVASVQVNGSLENYDVEVVPFKEISKSLRVLLWDQLHK